MTNLRPLFFAMIASGGLLINHPIKWLGAVFLLALVLAVLWLGLRLAEWFSGHVLWHRPKRAELAGDLSLVSKPTPGSKQ